MGLSKKTKELFKKHYGVEIDSEELFEALYQKRRKKADEAIKKIDDDTMRMMDKWK